MLSTLRCLTPSGNSSNRVDPGSLRTSFTGRTWYCYLTWLAVKWELHWELKEPELGRSIGVLWLKWICSPVCTEQVSGHCTSDVQVIPLLKQDQGASLIRPILIKSHTEEGHISCACPQPYVADVCLPHARAESVLGNCLFICFTILCVFLVKIDDPHWFNPFAAQALQNPWNFCSDSLIELQVSYNPKPAFKDEWK